MKSLFIADILGYKRPQDQKEMRHALLLRAFYKSLEAKTQQMILMSDMSAFCRKKSLPISRYETGIIQIDPSLRSLLGGFMGA